MAVDGHGRDHAEAVGLADMGETMELTWRQFGDGAEEAVVAGARGQRAEVALQGVGIARLDKAQLQRLAAAQAQGVGMLLEIIETKRGHGRAPVDFQKSM